MVGGGEDDALRRPRRRPMRAWQSSYAGSRSKPRIIVAGPDTPDVARCPACGGVVVKRQRRRMDGGITFYYRHKRGVGQDCPQRYQPA
jgi:hypothetical protein